MVRPGSPRRQFGAHRFLMRRMDYAILGRAMPAGADTLHAHRLALLAGCAGAVAVAVVTVGLAVLRPVAGDAPLVMSRQSGELFVRSGDRLHPVANLASAYLILGRPATPRLVDDAGLTGIPRGPVLGIPGAPPSAGAAMSSTDLRWTVCDDRDGSTTITAATADDVPELPARQGVLVTAVDGSVYLLYDGRRASVDPHDPAVARTLRLDMVTPRPVSSTLLNAVPEVPAIAPPQIAGNAVADSLPVATMPDDSPTLLDPSGEVCATWRAGRVTIAVGEARPAAVRLAIGDGGGPNVDAIRLPAGRWVDVTAGALTTDGGTSGRYLITEAGVRFPVRDSAAAAALGLGPAPSRVPWVILAALPSGPELSREAASVAGDVVAAASP